jgi:hypothetical protein
LIRVLRAADSRITTLDMKNMNAADSLRARTAHIAPGAILFWNGRPVRVVKIADVQQYRGRREAVVSVVGVNDGWNGTAFSCELTMESKNG